mmetsp:Transcript_33240/g.106709  ORF Transcript_33240/g.106709 Transcript_33240/m.106709 type:complete len:212 (+) Transcript_33240:1243-1878(+)
MDAVQVVHDRHQSEERAAEAVLYVLPPLAARQVLHLDKAAAAALTLLEPHDPNRPELLVEVHVTAVPLEALGDVEAGQRVRLDDVAASGPLEAVRAEAVQAHPREGLVRGAVRLVTPPPVRWQPLTRRVVRLRGLRRGPTRRGRSGTRRRAHPSQSRLRSRPRRSESRRRTCAGSLPARERCLASSASERGWPRPSPCRCPSTRRAAARAG